MTTNADSASQSAFNLFKSTLREASNKFQAWAMRDGDSDSFRRMKLAIAAHFEQSINLFISELSTSSENVNPSYFTQAESSFSKSFQQLGLSKRKTLRDCERVLEWVTEDLTMMLDAPQFGTRIPSTSQYHARSKKLREDAADLLYSFKKELTQEDFDTSLKQSMASLQDNIASSASLRDEVTNARNMRSLVEKLTAESKESASQVEKLLDLADVNAKKLEEYQRATEESAKRAELAEQRFLAVQNQQEVLNEKDSTTALVMHFGAFHTKHDESAKNYFRIGILTLIAVATFAVTFSFMHDFVEFDFKALAWKLAVVGGGTAIGTYFLRQSTYHRQLAVWSDTVQVQLQTFTPYIQQIGEGPSKDQLRVEFARRVFGEEPGRSTKESESKSDVNNLADLSVLLTNVSKLQSSNQQKNVT